MPYAAAQQDRYNEEFQGCHFQTSYVWVQSPSGDEYNQINKNGMHSRLVLGQNNHNLR